MILPPATKPQLDAIKGFMLKESLAHRFDSMVTVVTPCISRTTP
jgi:hypothetical protein